MCADLRFGYDGDGGLGDRLLDAVLRGEKTATSSLAIEYTAGERLPRVGEHLALTDGTGAVRGLVETTAVTIVPVDEVGDAVAHAEGEGFGDAVGWRAAHERFWTEVTPMIRAEIGDPGWSLRAHEPVVVHHFRLVSDAPVPEPSIQERLYPDLPCFGCGHSNANGLRLRSYGKAGGTVTASFLPWPEHDNGLGYLNGGIIATLLDCHSAAAVVVEAEARGWQPLGDAQLPYVTAGIDVRYRRPSPLHEPVSLEARVTEAGEVEMRVEVSLRWEDKVRAEASARWRRWRPRD